MSHLMEDKRKIEEIAATLRSMVKHETTQVNRRLSWLCQIQGFLFAALGIVWEKGSKFMPILAIMGIVVAVLVFNSLIGSTAALNRIRRYWSKRKPKDYDGPDIFGLYPEKPTILVFACSENMLPIVFVVGWLLAWHAS